MEKRGLLPILQEPLSSCRILAIGLRDCTPQYKLLSMPPVKLKFHYANFATKSGTSSRQSRARVADTNHESPRHVMSPTFMICVADFCDFCPRQSPRTFYGFMICHCLCSRLSPRGSFSESRRNGIWALLCTCTVCQ